MKLKRRTIKILCLACTIIISGSCKKSEIIAPDGEVVLTEVNEVLLNSAKAYASVDYKWKKITSYGFCWSTNPGPGMDDATTEVIYDQPFNAYLEGLEENTTYYLRAYISTLRKTYLSNEISFTTGNGMLSDIDGNVYDWVQIGHQGWMAQNLRTTRYSDGTNIYVNSEYGNRFYWYGSKHTLLTARDPDMDEDGDIDSEDSLIYVNRYGLLYSWYSANNEYDLDFQQQSGKVTEDVCDVCPEGWHVPSIEEWDELDLFLRFTHGSDSAGIVLKSKDYWLQNIDGTDYYGFGAIPAGLWHDPDDVHWRSMGNLAKFWSSTPESGQHALSIRLDHDDNSIYESFGGRGGGYSVRCIKDK